MRPQIATATTTALTAAFLTTAAMAGDLSQVTTDPVPTAPSTDWSGLYGGLTLSKSTGSYFGDFSSAGTHFPAEEGDLDGVGYGLLLGHNWQKGKFVYGAELSLSGQDINGSESCPNDNFDCNAKIDRLGSLRVRAGMLMGEKSLAFATLGYAAADITASAKGLGLKGEHTERFTGFVYGIGMEHALNQRYSIRASVLKHDFGSKDLEVLGIAVDDFNADFTTLELGFVMRF
ncbi:outer membrane beta-barrel protein [uncultured Pelagimonas sp.]|uniref:outer membrane protein n=1 Tax=uncultured Pelagimonas sp. TaxID=1618102 RepID=UPI00262225BB|nr:outer membrane beta-barrel protein [uncultured Pelagimonas sp.]